MRNPKQKKPAYLAIANPDGTSTDISTQAKRGEQRSVVTSTGKARGASQDIDSFALHQETLALLKILALGNQQFLDGKIKRLDEVMDRLKNKYAGLTSSKLAKF